MVTVVIHMETHMGITIPVFITGTLVVTTLISMVASITRTPMVIRPITADMLIIQQQTPLITTIT
jgi:phosphoribosylcarboxyaminoimidazole (NCAIR) mutase